MDACFYRALFRQCFCSILARIAVSEFCDKIRHNLNLGTVRSKLWPGANCVLCRRRGAPRSLSRVCHRCDVHAGACGRRAYPPRDQASVSHFYVFLAACLLRRIARRLSAFAKLAGHDAGGLATSPPSASSDSSCELTADSCCQASDTPPPPCCPPPSGSGAAAARASAGAPRMRALPPSAPRTCAALPLRLAAATPARAAAQRTPVRPRRHAGAISFRADRDMLTMI